MEKRNLYVIIVIVLVSGLALSFYSNFTGESVLGNCIDSDGGDNPHIAGTVKYTIAKAVYKDECYSKGELGIKKYLKERYCIVTMDTKLYLCENGCLENAKGEGYCAEGVANRIYS